MSDLTREETKAHIDAAEARTDTKIARMEGKLDLVLSKLDDVRSDNRSTRANIWVVGFGLAALIVASIFGLPTVFNMGMQLRDTVRSEVQSALPDEKSSVLPEKSK